MVTIAFAFALTVIWVLAWGTLSVANVLGGIVVSLILLTVAPDTWPRRGIIRVRPLAVARFILYVLGEALIANMHLARQVLARRPRLSTGVVGIPLPMVNDALLTVIANTIALTPGTMPIEVDHEAESTTIYVHFLQLEDVEAGRRSIQRLAGFVYGAFGSAEAIAALEASRRPPEGVSS